MILLDSHILVWLLIAPENPSPKAKKGDRGGPQIRALAISAISLWEIAWLVENKRIEVDVGVGSFVKKCGSCVQVLPITQEIAVRSVQFPKSYPNSPQAELLERPRLWKTFVF
jgi:PIN domain nuclease of toxin-antitoxin system